MPTKPSLPSPLLVTALQYARRGWRIFPCRERDEQFTGRSGKPVILKAKAPYASKERDATGKEIPNSGGLRQATTDERQITEWWTKWPHALIGAATGPGMDAFVVDFDIFDKKTGEVFDLAERIAALETAIGATLPETAMATTAGGGCHLYFALPDVPEGMRLGNSNKKLPFKIDVRGDDTGYVIVPPSKRLDLADSDTHGEYRWVRRYSEVGVLPAPPALLELLFVPIKGKAAPKPTAAEGGTVVNGPWERNDRSDGRGLGPSAARLAGGDAAIDAIEKYGLRALDGELRAVRTARSGSRNNQLNESALKIASLTVSTPHPAIDAGLARAMIEAAARDNPGDDDDAQLIATIDSGWSAGLNNARDLSEIAASARERAARFADRAERSRGRAGGRIDPSSPHPSYDDDGKPPSHAGGSGGDSGKKGSGGPDGGDLTRECAFLPLTDLGNKERFLKRFGGDFRFVEAWQWMAWDGRRWNRERAKSMLGRAVHATMRLIQDEAAMVAASGVPMPEGALDDLDDKAAREGWDHGRLQGARADWLRQRMVALRTDHDGPRLDYIAQVKSSGEIVLYSDKLKVWGRTSEAAGHISCIATLLQADLSALTDEFDVDPLMLNVENGMLVFLRADEGYAATVSIREHRREDMITKLAAVSYDPAAKSPRYDAFLEKVQPEADMRDFLDVWAGYNSLGLADAQKMALFYGEGSNGKGVWINTHAHILGDYAWATGIETFIDQGKYRKGSDASPDLAALSGRRMVYANEPEENSKFSDGLIKAMTSDEPLNVRENFGAPFQLLVTFTTTVSANNKPRIGTDHGIKRRMQLVPWNVIIPDEEQDIQLKAKLKAEASGILNRAVKGALAYLTSGVPQPEAVKEATREYVEENDILGQFLMLCIRKVPGETIGASALHGLFAAWQTWANQLPASGKPWSPKYLNGQMQKKGFHIRKSSSMVWDDIYPTYQQHDFTDHEGKAVTGDLRQPTEPPAASGTVASDVTASSSPPGNINYDDDLPP